MRRLLAAFLLSAAAAVAHAEAPTYAEKFEAYVAAGWPPDQVVAGLQRWFGTHFELVTITGETYVQLVLRRPDHSIYQLEIIGKLPSQPSQ